MRFFWYGLNGGKPFGGLYNSCVLPLKEFNKAEELVHNILLNEGLPFIGILLLIKSSHTQTNNVDLKLE